jgi:hypothetical protein
MKYEKPEIVKLNAACEAIQGSGKSGQNLEINHQPTNPAYEADE